MDEMNNTVNNVSRGKSGKKLRVIIAVVLGVIAVLAAGIITGFVMVDVIKNKASSVVEEAQDNESDAEGSIESVFLSSREELFSNGFLSVYDGSKWGYIDENGDLVISCQFDYAGEFTEDGFAAVAVGDKYGVIGKDGRYVINPMYEDVVPDCSEGLFAVCKDGKYGYIDKTGKMVIDCVFDSVSDFRNGYAIVLSGSEYAVIDKKGEFVIEPRYEDMTFAYDEPSDKNIFLAKKDSLYGYINEKGKTVIDFSYDYIKAHNGSLCFIDDKYVIASSDGKEGIVSSDGGYFTDERYTQLDYIGNDIFAFTDINGIRGFVDAKGNETAGAQFNEVSILSCGLIRVKLEDCYGFTDADGRYVINPNFTEANDFRNGYAVVKKDDKYSFVDTQGNIATDFMFDYMSDFSTDGHAVAGIGNKYYIIDTKGNYSAENCYYFYAEPSTGSIYDDYLCFMDASKTVNIVSLDAKEIARSFDGAGGICFDVCEAENCFELLTGEEECFCYTHQVSASVFSGHQIDYSYSQNYMAYLRNPSARTAVYVSCGVAASGHWISGYDPVTIHEVYTDGCCKVSYFTDSGEVKTYYASIYDFGTGHIVSSYYGSDYTAYLKYPGSRTTVYTSCGVVASGHWISGYDPVTIHEVYTDGCCKVSYITDSGAVRTYYAKISDFTTMHTLSYGYGYNFIAYLRNPSAKTKVYTSCGVVASGHWISGSDHVIIHEVYTDGCCKVSYTTDSGAVKTYYARISDFTF